MGLYEKGLDERYGEQSAEEIVEDDIPVGEPD
jgi:hypothetical protein